MFDKVIPLSKAVERYDLMNKIKVQKVVFEGRINLVIHALL